MKAILAWVAMSVVTASAWAGPVVVRTPGAAFHERLAAKEIARYVYVRTGELPAIAEKIPPRGDAVTLAVDKSLGQEAFAIATQSQDGRRVWSIRGGSPLAVLYGAYRFAEKLGVRF